MMDIIIYIVSLLFLITISVLGIVFVIHIIASLIYDFPMKRIKELERQIVVVADGFKAKYKEYVSEYGYLFDDEDWYAPMVKHFLKDFFIDGDIHNCIHGDTNYAVEKLILLRDKCCTKPFRFFCDEFISDVRERRSRAVFNANRLLEFYDLINRNRKNALENAVAEAIRCRNGNGL